MLVKTACRYATWMDNSRKAVPGNRKDPSLKRQTPARREIFTTEEETLSPDQINCCFELGAGVFLAFNIVKLHRDKKVRGACIPPVFFMATWGVYGF